MSTVNVDTINPSTLSEVSIPSLDPRLAKAWVNFDGTGVVTILSSYNVSSLVDNGSGNYTVSFGSPLNNANYSTSVTSLVNASVGTGSTSGVIVVSRDSSGVPTDYNNINVQVFSN